MENELQLQKEQTNTLVEKNEAVEEQLSEICIQTLNFFSCSQLKIIDQTSVVVVVFFNVTVFVPVKASYFFAQ